MSWRYFNRSKPSPESMYQIIRSPVITEKSTLISESNQVVFKVAGSAGKSDIRAAVESLFGVKVTAVNTLNVRAKTRRFKGRVGHKSGYKKAIVTLAEGESIDIGVGI